MANISIDQLAGEIVRAVQDYTEDVSIGIEKEVDRTAKSVLDDIQTGSPVKKGEYQKGWKRKKEGVSGKTKYTIFNKDKGSIAHLLEFGHAKTGGGRVAGKPHIRPAYERNVSDMEGRIKRIIQNGGGS